MLHSIEEIFYYVCLYGGWMLLTSKGSIQNFEVG